MWSPSRGGDAGPQGGLLAARPRVSGEDPARTGGCILLAPVVPTGRLLSMMMMMMVLMVMMMMMVVMMTMKMNVVLMMMMVMMMMMEMKMMDWWIE